MTSEPRLLICAAKRCIRITERELMVKISSALAALPHFFHIGTTRLVTIGSGKFPRLAVVSGISDKKPDLELERA
jgi:hypothetical protein